MLTIPIDQKEILSALDSKIEKMSAELADLKKDRKRLAKNIREEG